MTNLVILVRLNMHVVILFMSEHDISVWCCHRVSEPRANSACVAERGIAGAEGAEGAMATCCVRVLRRLRAAAPSLPPEAFVSTKLTNKLHQQLQEPLTLAAAATPLW